MANNVSKLSSLKVGETHFNLGNDKFIDQTGHGQNNKWSPGKNILGDKIKETNSNSKEKFVDMKTINQRSNFKIGQGNLVHNQFYSMQKQAMDSVKNKSKSGLGIQNKGKTQEPIIDMKAEVQKTHFNLGTSKLDYVSYAGGTMVEHQITPGMVIETDKNRKAAIEQMRNANFKIPNQQVLKTGQSTYK